MINPSVDMIPRRTGGDSMMDRMKVASNLDKILLWCLYEKCVHAKYICTVEASAVTVNS